MALTTKIKTASFLQFILVLRKFFSNDFRLKSQFSTDRRLNRWEWIVVFIEMFAKEEFQSIHRKKVTSIRRTQKKVALFL